MSRTRKEIRIESAREVVRKIYEEDLIGAEELVKNNYDDPRILEKFDLIRRGIKRLEDLLDSIYEDERGNYDD